MSDTKKSTATAAGFALATHTLTAIFAIANGIGWMSASWWLVFAPLLFFWFSLYVASMMVGALKAVMPAMIEAALLKQHQATLHQVEDAMRKIDEEAGNV